MQKKLTKDEKAEKLAGLTARIGSLEHGNSRLFAELRMYVKASPIEQQDFREQWENYYRLCKMTKAAQLFAEQLEAFRDGNHERVREIANIQKERMTSGEHIAEPKCPNPIKLENDPVIYSWKVLKQALKDLQNPMQEQYFQEQAEVWV